MSALAADQATDRACRCWDRDRPLPHEGHCCLGGPADLNEWIGADGRLTCGHHDDAMARNEARRSAR